MDESKLAAQRDMALAITGGQPQAAGWIVQDEGSLLLIRLRSTPLFPSLPEFRKNRF
jgi:hypothetical protein